MALRIVAGDVPLIVTFAGASTGRSVASNPKADRLKKFRLQWNFPAGSRFERHRDDWGYSGLSRALLQAERPANRRRP